MTEGRPAARRRIVFVLLVSAFFLLGADGLRASAGARQLGAEVQYLEQKLASPMSPAERHGVLVRLARLRQLSGDIAVAAELWLRAAELNPADDFALVSGAYGLAAIGEWERAAAAIRPLLASGRSGPSVLQARYLYATLRAWVASDISALAFLAGDPEAAVLRPIVYYTLWWTEARDPVTFGGNAEVWRQRLISGFPRSPEARIVAGASPAISAVHSPLWLLLPGMPAGAPTGVPEDSALAGILRGPAPAQSPSPGPAAAAPTHGQQIGLFRSETNARNQAQALGGAGFHAVVSRRLVNGVEHWAVVVPTHDSAGTAHRLRMVGYDSFTVRLE